AVPTVVAAPVVTFGCVAALRIGAPSGVATRAQRPNPNPNPNPKEPKDTPAAREEPKDPGHLLGLSHPDIQSIRARPGGGEFFPGGLLDRGSPPDGRLKMG